MYYITTNVFLKAVSFIYFVAFLTAYNDWHALLGSKGLTPVHLYFEQIKSHGFMQIPTLFFYLPPTDFNCYFLIVTGLFLSVVTFFIIPSMIFYFLLWAIYMSLVNVGQTWYSFGWESQLLELGFQAIFAAPIYRLKGCFKPSFAARYASLWMITRIMLGAGLIKIRGDKCWLNLTCMNYHYQTQPVPNPLSWLLHKSPESIHGLEVFGNHLVELLAPIFIMVPHRQTRMTACGIQIAFQVILILSGNLSFLNWLTIVPCLQGFDDRFWCQFSASWKRKHKKLTKNHQHKSFAQKLKYFINILIELGFASLIIYLSIQPTQNLFSSRQIMNTSFDTFKIVNTYGAFGSVGKERTEIIVKGKYNDGKWEEYQFKCKPGDISRRPCVISPYHYRLDWLAWFAGFQPQQYQPWTIHFVAKLLQNDETTLSLIEYNPFEGKKAPDKVKIDLYKYEYSQWGEKGWWRRQFVKEYLPELTLKNDQMWQIIRQMKWMK